MRATIAIEFGWCGLGFAGGLVPTLKLGLVAVWWVRGSVSEMLSGLRVALAEAAKELKRSVQA